MTESLQSKSMLEKTRERINVFGQYRFLLSQLIITDIKLKYRRSFLGYIWSVLNPLMIMIVMTLVFSRMFNRTIDHYPVYLMGGQLLFTFMRESTSHCISAITGNASVLKMTYVPKYIFVLSKVVSDFINLLFSMAALLIVMFATGIRVTPYFYLVFIPLIELLVFCVGISFFLAQLAVFFRDIQYIWGVICTAWLYLTPIFYAVESLPDNIGWLIKRFNPMYYYITIFRNYTWEGVEAWPANIIRGAILAGLMTVVGVYLFTKNKNKFILYI